MKQAQKRVTQQMDRDRDVARQLVADGKRDRALLLLKRKKRMEQSLFDLDGKLEVLEKMVSDIEFSQIELKLIDGLKTGNTALKHLNQLLSVENVQSIMDETRESADRQKVRSFLSMQTGGSNSCLSVCRKSLICLWMHHSRQRMRRIWSRSCSN
jgi:charged multivesicular body protein 6